MKNILILKDNHKSYLALIGCVILNKPLDLILQMEADSNLSYEISAEMNEWLVEKGYPQITCGCQTSTVLDTIEAARGKAFNSFPNQIHQNIETKSGLLIQCDYDNLDIIECISTWGWDDDDVSDLVLHFSNLPEDLRPLIDELSNKSDEVFADAS